MSERSERSDSAFQAIRSIDYTIVFVRCADELMRRGIALVSPPTDRAFGHRTLFFRDPDRNLLEVFGDIEVQKS